MKYNRLYLYLLTIVYTPDVFCCLIDTHIPRRTFSTPDFIGLRRSIATMSIKYDWLPRNGSLSYSERLFRAHFITALPFPSSVDDSTIQYSSFVGNTKVNHSISIAHFIELIKVEAIFPEDILFVLSNITESKQNAATTKNFGDTITALIQHHDQYSVINDFISTPSKIAAISFLQESCPQRNK